MVYEKLFIILIWLIKWLIFPVFGYLAWRYYIKSRHEEHKMMIQQGIKIDDGSSLMKKFKFPWLKIGIVIIGLSLGLLIIAILVNYGVTGKSDAIYPAIIGICGGLSFLIAHYLGNHKKPE